MTSASSSSPRFGPTSPTRGDVPLVPRGAALRRSRRPARPCPIRPRRPRAVDRDELGQDRRTPPSSTARWSALAATRSLPSRSWRRPARRGRGPPCSAARRPAGARRRRLGRGPAGPPGRVGGRLPHRRRAARHRRRPAAAAVRAALREVIDRRVLVAAPDRSDARYVFSHALLREVIHGSLLPGERARLHAQICRGARGSRSGTSPGRSRRAPRPARRRPPPRSAYHWEAAGDPATGPGRDGRRGSRGRAGLRLPRRAHATTCGRSTCGRLSPTRTAALDRVGVLARAAETGVMLGEYRSGRGPRGAGAWPWSTRRPLLPVPRPSTSGNAGTSGNWATRPPPRPRWRPPRSLVPRDPPSAARAN